MEDHEDLDDLDDESSLIQRAREGDEAAYGELFSRHHRAALNYARAIAGANEADDLVAEAFAKLLSALQRDLGPATSFRSYLFTSIRRLWANTLRSRAKYDVVEDVSIAADKLNSRSAASAGDSWREEAIGAAFRQLPERWREVLWLGTVDGYSQTEIAHQLNIKANAVAALSFRAREGLRREYLAQHLSTTSDPTCQTALPLLPAYVRGTLDRKKLDRASSHLEGCVNCTSAVSNLRTISDNLAVALPALAAGGWLYGHHVSVHSAIPPVPEGAVGAPGQIVRRVAVGVGAAGIAALVTLLVWPAGTAPRKVPAAPERTPTIQITDLGLVPHHKSRRPTRPAAKPAPQAPISVESQPVTPRPTGAVPAGGGQGTTVTGTTGGQSPSPVQASAP